MKNTVPLIIAVVLGLIAVFAVSRMIRPKDADKENQYGWVVSAARDITPGDGAIKESWLMKRKVDLSSIPAKAIPWNQINRVIGQKTVRTISRNDYVLSSDVSGMDIRLSGALAEGEWAVPVTFSDPSLVKFLQPGDEVAILGLSTVQEIQQKTDTTEEPDVVERQVTSVVFPCVRILDVGKGDAIRRGEDGDDSQRGTIVVALTPSEAATLVAAQRTMELYPALRRPEDVHARKRRDVGMVTEETFKGLKAGLESVQISDLPKDK